MPVRYPSNEKEAEYYYSGDDPFYNELAAICCAQDRKINAGETRPATNNVQDGTNVEGDDLLPNRILSSFEDATKTYEFSWKIRLESEKNRL